MKPVKRVTEGPSKALIAWRRFIIETLLLFELLAVIAVVGLGGSKDLFAGALIAMLIAAVLRILRSREPNERGPA